MVYKRFIEPALAVVIGIAIVACSIAIAEPGSESKNQPQIKLPTGWTEADMQACMAASTPGKMHEQLAKGAGDWQGKQANADYVRKQFGLAVSRGPIFGLVARLVHQKGVDLVLSAADEIIEAGGQIVVTGSGEPAIEQALVEAHRRRPDAIAVSIGFNDGQARRIFAGSDFTLMPSRFEPCGLSQMYAQRFGSLPIGHQTGGLAETIKDGETGFLFSQPSAESFLGGVRRAFEAFTTKDRLDTMRRSAMARTFSWDLSASLYNALYRKTVGSHVGV